MRVLLALAVVPAAVLCARLVLAVRRRETHQAAGAWLVSGVVLFFVVVLGCTVASLD